MKLTRSLAVAALVLLVSPLAMAKSELCQTVFRASLKSGPLSSESPRPTSPVKSIESLGRSLISTLTGPSIQSLSPEQVADALAFKKGDIEGRRSLNTPPMPEAIANALKAFPKRPISVRKVKSDIKKLLEIDERAYLSGKRVIRWNSLLRFLAEFYKQDKHLSLKAFFTELSDYRDRTNSALGVNIVWWPVGEYTGDAHANHFSVDPIHRGASVLRAINEHNGPEGSLPSGFRARIEYLGSIEGMILVNPNLLYYLELTKLRKQLGMPELVFHSKLREVMSKEGDVWLPSLIEKIQEQVKARDSRLGLYFHQVLD